MAPSQKSNVAVDNSSCDQLSFTSLVCVQDQKPKNNPKNAKQLARQEQSFEFSRGAIESLALNSSNNRLSDLLMPDVQLLQQQSQPQVKQCHYSTHQSSKGSDERCSSKPDGNKIRKQAVKSSVPSSGLSCKIFQSFMSPCRECRAVNPDVKAPATAQRK